MLQTLEQNTTIPIILNQTYFMQGLHTFLREHLTFLQYIVATTENAKIVGIHSYYLHMWVAIVY